MDKRRQELEAEAAANAKTFGKTELEMAAWTLRIWSQTAPQQGDYCHICAMISDQITQANDRIVELEAELERRNNADWESSES